MLVLGLLRDCCLRRGRHRLRLPTSSVELEEGVVDTHCLPLRRQALEGLVIVLVVEQVKVRGELDELAELQLLQLVDVPGCSS